MLQNILSDISSDNASTRKVAVIEECSMTVIDLETIMALLQTMHKDSATITAVIYLAAIEIKNLDAPTAPY